jgi:hypothetical protein
MYEFHGASWLRELLCHQAGIEPYYVLASHYEPFFVAQAVGVAQQEQMLAREVWNAWLIAHLVGAG